MEPVDEVDVGVARRSEHGRGAAGATCACVAGPVDRPVVGLDLDDASDAPARPPSPER